MNKSDFLVGVLAVAYTVVFFIFVGEYANG